MLAERALEVRDPVVEAERVDVVVPASAQGVALVLAPAYPVRPKCSQRVGELRAVRGNHPALAGGQRLYGVKAEHVHVGEPVAADRATAARTAERVARVLDHDHARGPRVLDRLEVDRQPGHRHGHARLGSRRQPAPHRAGEVEIRRDWVDVREHRPRADEQRAVRRGHEAHRGRQHLVAEAEPGRRGGSVQRGRAVGERDGMGGVHVVGDRPLERVDPRALGDHRVEQGLRNDGDVALIDGLAAVREEVAQGTACSEGSSARSASALS